MDIRGKKFLITGATGFLGSWVKKQLIGKGVDSTNIRVFSSKECDLRKWKECEKVVSNIDIVIHAAAITGVASFHATNPGSIFYDNIIMGAQLMEAARQAGVQKFISIGSATEYPSSCSVPFQEENIWNGYPELSHAPYSIAKRALAVQGSAYNRQYGFTAIQLLPPNLYGPGSKDFYVIPSLIRKIIEAKKNNETEIEVWGTGNATREFLYIEDAAEAVFAAIQRCDCTGSINIGTGVETSIKELVSEMCGILDFTGSIRYNSNIVEDHKRRVLDVHRAQELLGWKAKTSLQQGLQKTITQYSEKNKAFQT